MQHARGGRVKGEGERGRGGGGGGGVENSPQPYDNYLVVTGGEVRNGPCVVERDPRATVAEVIDPGPVTQFAVWSFGSHEAGRGSPVGGDVPVA